MTDVHSATELFLTATRDNIANGTTYIHVCTYIGPRNLYFKEAPIAGSDEY